MRNLRNVDVKRRQKIKHRGFTDRLYFLNLVLSWIFIIICITITMLSGVLNITDLSIVSVGIPAVFAELGLHTSFIIWKAKSENAYKFNLPQLDDISV